jgi:hypothetical protein
MGEALVDALAAAHVPRVFKLTLPRQICSSFRLAHHNQSATSLRRIATCVSSVHHTVCWKSIHLPCIMNPCQLLTRVLCSTDLANSEPCLPFPQARNISNMKTLPRKMLPANLTGLKTALYKLLFSNMQPATASASAAALPAGKQQSEQLSNSVNAATAVLERPTATTPVVNAGTVLDRPAMPEVQAPKRRASEYHNPPVSQ